MAIGTPYLIGAKEVGAGGTVVQITLTSSPMTAGDAIIVSGGANVTGTSTLPVSCTDTQNNPYVLLNSYSANGGAYQFVCLNSNALSLTGNGGNADVITVTFAASGTAKEIIAIGCPGVSAVSALDQIGSFHAGSTAAPSVSTPAQLQSGDLAVGLFVYPSTGGAPTWGGGWTPQNTTQSGSNPFVTVATQVLAGSAAVTASITYATASPVTGLVLTLSAGQNAAGVMQASVGFCASMTATQGASGSLTSTISFTATMNNNVALTNSWQSKAVSNYGLDPIPVNNVTGRGLLAFVAWNGAEINPVSNLADDAHNFWTHLGTTSVSGQVRCSVWACPNAQAATVVSAGLTWFAQGLVVNIAEMSGFPNWISLDGAVVTSFNNSANTLTLTGSASVQPDLVLAMVADANNTAIPKAPGAGWNPIFGAVSVNDPGGAGGPADVALKAFWKQVPAGVAPTVTFSTGGTLIPLSGVLVALNLTPPSPVQKNPNFPGMHYEAAFGYTPGDPTVMPVWTDITARVIGDSGQQSLQSQRGRQYESEGPEAGQLQLQLDNHDGAFTPGNASSPYYPNVVLGTPVRSWGTWSGRAYAVGSGYIERLPQTWPDGLTQYGLSPMVGVDALDPLSNSQMPSAFAGELLSDNPYGYWNFGDTYQQNRAGGMPFANQSRTNQRPFTGQNGVSINADGSTHVQHLQTGIQWFTGQTGQVTTFQGLPGDPNMGIGTSGFSGNVATTFAPGAFYSAPDLPQPINGMTLEFWATIPGLQSGHYQELLRISGPASNYYVGAGGGAGNAYARGARFLVRVNPGPSGSTGQDLLAIDFADFEGNDVSHTAIATITDNNPHHFVFQIGTTPSSTSYQLTVLLDGAVVSSGVVYAGVNVENDWNFIGVGGVNHSDGGISYGYNYTFGHLALFPVQLATSRVKAHYAAAHTGGSGDDSVTRVAKLFTYGGFGLQRACALDSPSPFMGPADQISGQSVVDAISTMATAEGGFLFCDDANNVTWWPRAFLYNRPVKWTLGDGPGETPYDPGEAYDFDNTFISNLVTVQRQASQNGNGAVAITADQPSQKQYFTRNGQQATVEVMADQDAYDLANWQLAKYRQPSLRVQQVVLDPAANPAVWPVALGVEQGDVVRLNRRPLGGAVISQLCIVQMVQHAGGPDNWATTLNLVPYMIESTVLQCDLTANNQIASNGIGW